MDQNMISQPVANGEAMNILKNDGFPTMSHSCCTSSLDKFLQFGLSLTSSATGCGQGTIHLNVTCMYPNSLMAYSCNMEHSNSFFQNCELINQTPVLHPLSLGKEVQKSQWSYPAIYRKNGSKKKRSKFNSNEKRQTYTKPKDFGQAPPINYGLQKGFKALRPAMKPGPARKDGEHKYTLDELKSLNPAWSLPKYF